MVASIQPDGAQAAASAATAWYLDAGNELRCTSVGEPTALTFDRGVPLAPPSDPLAKHLLVQPIAPHGTTYAVVLVPDDLALSVARNGILLPAGMHTLSHGDRLDTDAQTYWISGQSVPKHTQYDPVVHGPDVFCFLTKARLQPGQPITICPGLPGVSCTAIYKSEAWDKAMRPGSPIKCARCGYHPDLSSWKPIPPKPGTRDDEYTKYFDA